jgi:Ankyrin repeats (3 copies)
MTLGLRRGPPFEVDRGEPRTVGRDNGSDYNPWAAASQGDLPMLQQTLREMNLSVTAADEGQGYTIFHAAASYSQLGIMDWLLMQVPAGEALYRLVNAVDRDGDTALHYAGTATSARYLVETAGIDVNLRNEVGMTALDAKMWEVEATMQEEYFTEDNQDYIELKEIVEYLQSLSATNAAQ